MSTGILRPFPVIKILCGEEGTFAVEVKLKAVGFMESPLPAGVHATECDPSPPNVF